MREPDLPGDDDLRDPWARRARGLLRPSPQQAPAPRAQGGPRPLVELERVTRRYPHGQTAVLALDDVSLAFERGEMVAVVGPSGCGKSTLLDLLCGADRPDAGRVLFDGIDLARAGEKELIQLRRARVGVVFQSFHLLPNLTAFENVALPLALAGKRDPERVRALLERVGLGERMTHYPAQLSGGQEQRVAIARALVHRPELVVADEPTGNLDSGTSASILELLAELRREEGAALVIATHEPNVAAAASRVITLHDGRVVGDAR